MLFRDIARRLALLAAQEAAAYASCRSAPIAFPDFVIHRRRRTAPVTGFQRELISMPADATSSRKAASTSDGLPTERRAWAVAAIFTALAMASLDTAIANIALPAIASDLHVSPADVVWVVNIYQIALVATLLPLGALGEIVGHERIYIGGLLLLD